MKTALTSFLAGTFLLSLLTVQSTAQGFLKVSGKSIVNDNGEVLLRGMGLGGWLLPEGYMFHTSDFANAFWQMKNKVNDVVGSQKADTFWTAFRKNFVQRKDIVQLKQWGFNSIRPALHWEHFMNPDGSWRDYGFIVIDSLLQWCEENQIYVILDLHAAPGGQSANNISDYNPANPSLWESDTNKAMTASLWKRLAERYKDEVWIGGYDLLNEPAWNLPPSNQPLRDLYGMITDSIRAVDTTHIIFIEGNWYATDFTGLTPAWDEKMAYSFHKYWNSNNPSSISGYLSVQSSTNRPLWMGESGENSNVWFADCIALLEENNIGWSWWTLKKFETVSGPLTVPITPDYDALLKFWKGEGSQPTVENAMKGLMDMANGLKLENCVFHPDYIDAMMRQPYSTLTKPFAANTIPGKIFFADYDLGRILSAYNDNDYQSIGGGDWNSGWKYRNDGVDIEKCNDVVTNGYDVGWTATGEFLLYTVDVQQSGKYSVSLRVAANDAGGYVGMSWDGESQVLTPITQTGGWQTWTTQTAGEVELIQGKHTVRFNTFFGGFNLNYFDCAYVGPLSVNQEQGIPTEFRLEQNYPNPFNPSTVISYQLPINNVVVLKVFDVMGREVTTLVNEWKNAGIHTVDFNASNISAGIYFYTLRAGNFTQTKKLTLIK